MGLLTSYAAPLLAFRRSSILTSLLLPSTAICSASVLLGVLFTSFLFDSTVLFGTRGPVSPEIIGFVEAYYLTWWDGAMAVKMFLHVVVRRPLNSRASPAEQPIPVCKLTTPSQLLIAYVAVVGKFARYTDTTFFFSGASLRKSRHPTASTAAS